MSLTREYLESLDIETEKVESILSAYAESEIQKNVDFDHKLEEKNSEIERIKSEFARKEAAVKRRSVLSENLKNLGYSEAATRIIVNRSDFAERLEIAENGAPINMEEVVSEIQADADFSGFTPRFEENFTHTPSAPPANSGSEWTKEKIMAVKNTAERQRLISENHKIFGI